MPKNIKMLIVLKKVNCLRKEYFKIERKKHKFMIMMIHLKQIYLDNKLMILISIMRQKSSVKKLEKQQAKTKKKLRSGTNFLEILISVKIKVYQRMVKKV